MPGPRLPALGGRGGAGGRGGGHGVAQVGADLAGYGDLPEPFGDGVLVGVEAAAEAADQAVQVVAGAGELSGAAGGGAAGAGGGVHEDAAHRDGRVFLPLGIADLKRPGVFEDMPAAPPLRALARIPLGGVADLGGPGEVAGGQLGGLDVGLGGRGQERAAPCR